MVDDRPFGGRCTWVAIAALELAGSSLTRTFLAGGGGFAGCPSTPLYVGPPAAGMVTFEAVRTALVPGVPAAGMVVVG